mmetsp:Transcript_37003/g.60697  ORF Transcript_37003/g.60697 Transcript_37003/m.60697 type:complete len:209 (-) Transcript_37003:548-1174(-)
MGALPPPVETPPTSHPAVLGVHVHHTRRPIWLSLQHSHGNAFTCRPSSVFLLLALHRGVLHFPCVWIVLATQGGPFGCPFSIHVGMHSRAGRVAFSYSGSASGGAAFSMCLDCVGVHVHPCVRSLACALVHLSLVHVCLHGSCLCRCQFDVRARECTDMCVFCCVYVRARILCIFCVCILCVCILCVCVCVCLSVWFWWVAVRTRKVF